MGGSVHVTSKVKEGSTFSITFKAMCKIKIQSENSEAYDIAQNYREALARNM